MVDFEESRSKAFEALARTVTIMSMGDSERRVAGLQNYSIVWRIQTEVFADGNTVSPIVLFMALPGDFPLTLPKIYVSKEDKAWVGFIPHVDVKGYICLYDDESVIVDFNHPDKIVNECLRKALEIIEQGLKGENKNDFSDEFVAYWNEEYDENDEVCSGLMMLEHTPDNAPCRLKFLTLDPSFSNYHAILYDQGKYIERFRNFLKDKGYSSIEREGLYLGSINNLFPPFNFTNANAYQLVKDHFPKALKEFERYINRTTEYRLVTFSVISGTSHLFFGWYIKQLNTNRNGHRKGTLTSFNVFTTFQRNDRVIRLKFDAYTKERLEKRTDGLKSSLQYTITVAGVGSIGSNLLPYLMPIGIDTLHLIDPDTLTLANINRHLLAPDGIGNSKVTGIRNYLLQNNPLVDVVPHKESIVEFIRNKCDILNQSDYLIIVIGKNVLEDYISQALQEKQIKIPTFFIWIEPYILGGHCLYLQPGHAFNYHTLYENHLYKYNVVDNSEYQNQSKQILLREAGCQGSYMPYGQKSITLFLSSLIPYLFQIIDDKDTRNLAITWRGKVSNDISLKLSEYGKQLRENSIHVTQL